MSISLPAPSGVTPQAPTPLRPDLRPAPAPVNGTDLRRDTVPERTRVLIADPDALSRRLVRDHIAAVSGLVVIGDVRSGYELVELARYYSPEVVLMEARLPDMDGIDAIMRLRAAAPDTRVVLLSARAGTDVALQAFRAGAVGFFPKDRDPASLPRVVRKVAAGEAVVPRELTMVLLNELRRVPERGYRPIRSQLTTREWEIIDLIAEGVNTPEIADRLYVSQATVYTHIKHIMRKLGVRSRGDAVAAAQRLRPVELGMPAEAS